MISGKFIEVLAANEECSISVDAKLAGKGAVTCRVTRLTAKTTSSETSSERTETTPSGATRIIKETRKESKTTTKEETIDNVNVKVTPNNDGTYSISYKVKEPGQYTIQLKFGGQPIPGGLYTFTVS